MHLRALACTFPIKRMNGFDTYFPFFFLFVHLGIHLILRCLVDFEAHSFNIILFRKQNKEFLDTNILRHGENIEAINYLLACARLGCHKF